MRRDLFISMFLIFAVIAVFWQVRHHDFVNYDDDQYVTANHHVRAGLTRKGFIWAFTIAHAANWHPLTWVSHMLDCRLFGLNPSGHHLTSVLLHLANTLLLFFVLRRMTGRIWRSGFVAALFALHPLHVESVTWTAERKDVLSTLFWMLTMWTYVRYVERPGFKRYLLITGIFALGLMAKPMLVTLPFVLLLLDYWPLNRMGAGLRDGTGNSSGRASLTLTNRRTGVIHLVLEKASLFVLAAISSVLTFLAQSSGGAVESVDVIPLGWRIGNAIVTYVVYMGKMFWPLNLAVFYPHLGRSLPIWQPIAAGLLLVSISFSVIRLARSYPYLVVGWLWYLGTLVPVIGLVQVGSQGMADRYTYVPLIGLFMVISWGFPDLLEKWKFRRTALALSAGLVACVLFVCSWFQVRHWRDTTTLFTHAVKVTSNNHVAHNNLGAALAERGKVDEAIANYREALRIKPESAQTHNNLGVLLASFGRFDQAISHYAKALRLKPDSPDTHNNLGVALAKQGRINRAIAHYLKAVHIKTGYAEAYNNLGNTLAQQGKGEQAIAYYSKALQVKPTADAHNNLGALLARQGRLTEAISHFEEALRLKPDYVQARANLGLALKEASVRSGH